MQAGIQSPSKINFVINCEQSLFDPRVHSGMADTIAGKTTPGCSSSGRRDDADRTGDGREDVRSTEFLPPEARAVLDRAPIPILLAAPAADSRSGGPVGRMAVIHANPALARLAGRAARGFTDRLGERHGTPAGEVPVLTYDVLRQEVERRGPAAAEALAEAARDAAERGLDLPEQSRIVTERAWDLSGRSGPAIVLGFASMPYLATSLGEDPAARRLETACAEAAADVARRHGTTIRLLRYFPGISDMSFLGQADETAIPVIAANTPPWGAGIAWPDGPALGGVPIVNAGPWGRDYHTPLERLCVPYAFDVLPDLVGGIARRTLEDSGAGSLQRE